MVSQGLGFTSPYRVVPTFTEIGKTSSFLKHFLREGNRYLPHLDSMNTPGMCQKCFFFAYQSCTEKNSPEYVHTFLG